MLSDDGHALAHTGQASLTEDQQVYLRNVDSDVQEIASATGFGGDDWLPDWRLPAGPADPAPEIGSPPVASCSVSGPRVSFVADYQSGIYSFTCAPVIDGGFSGGLTSLSGTATVASAAGRVTVTVAITCGIFLIGCGGFMYLHYQDFPDGLKKDLVAFVVGGRCRWPDCRWPPRIWNLPIVRGAGMGRRRDVTVRLSCHTPSVRSSDGLGSWASHAPRERSHRTGRTSMALDEQSRHHVYDWARQTWDERAATTLMEMLPPVGWADVATKRDLDVLGTQLRLEMHSLEVTLRGEMHAFEARLTQRMLTTMLTGMGIQTAVIGTLLALIR